MRGAGAQLEPGERVIFETRQHLMAFSGTAGMALCVALVVLLDQFPRNLFRSSGEAFAYDWRAREIARALLATGFGRFFWVERIALVLPFEHSEELGDQDYAVLLSAELAVGAPENLRELCRGTLDYATRHRDIIRKFGRFPHRNGLLGRESTAEEAVFLAEKGRGW